MLVCIEGTASQILCKIKRLQLTFERWQRRELFDRERQIIQAVLLSEEESRLKVLIQVDDFWFLEERGWIAR